MTLIDEAKSISGWIVDLRRQLHRHPELMYEEVEMSRLVRATLDELGIAYRHSVAETASLQRSAAARGRCVALRADMDALPIQEQADVPFRSEIDGKIDESALPIGAALHVAIALQSLRVGG